MMFDKGDKQTAKAGRDVYQDNLTIYQSGTEPLTKSDIYNFLNLFQESLKANSRATFNIKHSPTELTKKLFANNAPRYNRIFKRHFLDYDNFETVIKENMLDGQEIVEWLMDCYDEIAEYQDNQLVYGDGDAHLTLLKEKIVHLIQRHPRYLENEMNSAESLNKFAIAFLAYAVSECQILLNPAKQDNGEV
ncbi:MULTISPECIES: hypothetical protein [Leuconostoc]|uniref:hypothetical protein n=1 Tax=Leuconostoc TaxID=1243 RepID=UPI0021A5CFF9|nr:MULTISPECIES: hypothetical protein [Leuconostoc]MCT4389016.1 hypothetical protein [Leuconostoc falkenbergense]